MDPHEIPANKDQQIWQLEALCPGGLPNIAISWRMDAHCKNNYCTCDTKIYVDSILYSVYINIYIYMYSYSYLRKRGDEQ